MRSAPYETILSTITKNGQFRVDLWQELENKETVFYFQIKDVFLKDKPIAIGYKFSLVHEDDEIIVQEGTSLDRDEPNSIRVKISDEITGPVLVQFENLDGKLLAHTEFPTIINRIELLSVPHSVCVVTCRQDFQTVLKPDLLFHLKSSRVWNLAHHDLNLFPLEQ